MADTNERTPLLKVEHLSKEFPLSPACSPSASPSVSSLQ